MLDATTARKPAHAGADHPAIKPAKVGVLLANLGTPDATDYWSMRRYLNEFLSDKRVIDYASWKWQPLLQLIQNSAMLIITRVHQVRRGGIGTSLISAKTKRIGA